MAENDKRVTPRDSKPMEHLYNDGANIPAPSVDKAVNPFKSAPKSKPKK